jgi:hypothetical protein
LEKYAEEEKKEINGTEKAEKGGKETRKRETGK